MVNNKNTKIISVIIAGGRSSRMGGVEKCLLPLKEKLILDRIIEKLSKQTDRIIINANGNKDRFAFTKLEVIEDITSNSEGPLIGIYSAMKYIYNRTEDKENTYIACVPSDSPFIPDNLISKLYDCLKDNDADATCVKIGDRINPIFNLLPITLLESLENTVKNTEIRAIYKWLQNLKLATVNFEKEQDFFNINTKEDLAIAENIAGSENN